MLYGQILHNEKMCRLQQISCDWELLADFKEAYETDKVCYSIYNAIICFISHFFIKIKSYHKLY